MADHRSSSFVPVPFQFDVTVTEKRIVELKKMAMEFLKSRLRAIVYAPGTTPIDWRLFSILFLSMVRIGLFHDLSIFFFL